MPSGHVPVKGSEREPVPGTKKVGPVPADQEVRITVIVRRRGDVQLPAGLPRVLEGGQTASRAPKTARDLWRQALTIVLDLRIRLDQDDAVLR